MRVLLVDDEADLASALAERLQLREIAADWAATAEEALEKASAVAYDVAVLDIRMPRISGIELRAKLYAIQPELKFIFLTGYGSEADFREVTCQVGQECYLVKPVDIQQLIDRMYELVDTRREAP